MDKDFAVRVHSLDLSAEISIAIAKNPLNKGCINPYTYSCISNTNATY